MADLSGIRVLRVSILNGGDNGQRVKAGDILEKSACESESAYCSSGILCLEETLRREVPRAIWLLRGSLDALGRLANPYRCFSSQPSILVTLFSIEPHDNSFAHSTAWFIKMVCILQARNHQRSRKRSFGEVFAESLVSETITVAMSSFLAFVDFVRLMDGSPAASR
ncbi:hypothetical protein M436DRAFT_68492 [Aureobasidium namibiae CBS 147.97]|uniref:Uncharacterized protein n=1 Tax=Aureobasidium namibiae CBS 147.97 TaxID=1043004 RepID=A0A074X071_9PEZI|nr:uncharacterized protein M436DRAFT_68492 [Aureobasidium namibiae CBS 147.97]KEQ68051.1 hypothetical protein M436DRAFT_68492 [Aureobasidium namibiae CBS 147.97]